MRRESTSISYNPWLAELLKEYDVEKAAKKFIGRKAAPIFNSPECQGTYPIMNRENFKKRVSTRRVQDGSYNRIDGTFGSGTYECEEHGIEERIDRRRRVRYRNLFDAKAAAQQQVWYQQLLNHEYRVHALFDGMSLTNTNVSTAWSTVASGVPLTDLETQFEKLEDACGCVREDLTVIIPRADFKELTHTDQVNDKLKYTFRMGAGIQPSMITAKQVADMLNIKQVLVARSVQDSADEGQSESNAQIWTAGVIYIGLLAEENDPLETPGGARTVVWDAYESGFPGVYDYGEERTNSDIVRVIMDTDEVAIGDADLFIRQLTNT